MPIYPSVAKTGLAASGGAVKEQYIPLWVYSSSSVSTPTSVTSAGVRFVSKGGGFLTSAQTLHTLNPSWQSGQKFVLETSLNSSNGSTTANVALWDITAGAIVSGSTVSTTSTPVILLRSNTFNLIPGHSYGITAWNTTSTSVATIIKAHLIAINY